MPSTLFFNITKHQLCVYVYVALGVGLKALPGLKTVETPDASGDHPDYSLPGMMQDEGTRRSLSTAHDEAVESQAQQAVVVQDRTTTAMHSIMEQGAPFFFSSVFLLYPGF